MKLAAIAVFAALAATPALAAAVYPDSGTATVAPDPDPGVDRRVAMENQARQNYYQHQLEAANAQTEADNARPTPNGPLPSAMPPWTGRPMTGRTSTTPSDSRESPSSSRAFSFQPVRR
jgi:hypothetical protein